MRETTRGEGLPSVWQQALAEGEPKAGLEGKSYPVAISRAKQLRIVEFTFGPWRIVGIEQKPQPGLQWAALARQESASCNRAARPAMSPTSVKGECSAAPPGARSNSRAESAPPRLLPGMLSLRIRGLPARRTLPDVSASVFVPLGRKADPTTSASRTAGRRCPLEKISVALIW